MTTVLAQGTFDVLHPGHVDYLEQAAARGDELHVIVARSENVTHKPSPVLGDEQRRRMVAALDPVDEAHVGHPSDIFVPLEEIDPDVVVLGHDQHHDEADLAAALDAHGLDCTVERADPADVDFEGAVLSTSTILRRILDARQHASAARMRPPTLRQRPL
ncbi:FAD synthase [Halobacterium wangiae]|uniref:FAD synthase n=1 Tax=Halobacterium wangiae TaxID=2902623 RepID=UPI001E4A17D2|nr:FAD synthase [Halobacterium wangiae]